MTYPSALKRKKKTGNKKKHSPIKSPSTASLYPKGPCPQGLCAAGSRCAKSPLEQTHISNRIPPPLWASDGRINAQKPGDPLNKYFGKCNPKNHNFHPRVDVGDCVFYSSDNQAELQIFRPQYLHKSLSPQMFSSDSAFPLANQLCEQLCFPSPVPRANRTMSSKKGSCTRAACFCLLLGLGSLPRFPAQTSATTRVALHNSVNMLHWQNDTNPGPPPLQSQGQPFLCKTYSRSGAFAVETRVIKCNNTILSSFILFGNKKSLVATRRQQPHPQGIPLFFGLVSPILLNSNHTLAPRRFPSLPWVVMASF